ncbi:cytochrome P450 [Gigaspora margarita]|uniref:Cytochrome P450 n=1 Tax=Gigaspora margarita TaxID=4874 RepID=A0A8H4B3H8_GIGMA|nr:cytochrome P450 [Gigaspora margarita]
MNYYLVAIFTFIGHILYKYYIYPLYLSPLLKIPGPPVDNFISGHLGSLLKDKQGEVFTHLAKQYGRIVRYHALLNKPYLLIFDQQLVHQILITRPYEFPKLSFNYVMVKDLIGIESISFAEENAHKRQRKLINPSFTFANVKEMLPTLIQAGHKFKDILLKQIGNKKEERITITDLIPKITLDIIGLVGFNYEFDSITSDSELARAYHSLLSKQPSPLFGALINLFPFIRKFPTSHNKKYWDSLQTINDISEKLIAEQKNATIRGKDFLSLVIKTNEKLPVDEQLSHRELISLIMTLLITGHETTSNALAWALYYLAKNPDIQKNLRKEILDEFSDHNNSPTFEAIDQLKYLDCVFKETLRISPPATVIMRYNSKDENLNGYFIPKGTPMVIPIYAIHHDPLIWGEDVESFNPSRWLNPEIKSKITNSNYLPFGAGVRSCLGMRMAHLEFKCFLLILIRNFEFKLVEGFTFKKLTNGLCKPDPKMDLLISKVEY